MNMEYATVCSMRRYTAPRTINSIARTIGPKRSAGELQLHNCRFCRSLLCHSIFAIDAFDPVEQIFAEIKHYLRKAGPRTRDELWRSVGKILPCQT